MEGAHDGEGGAGARVRVQDVLATSAQLALEAVKLIQGIERRGPASYATVNKASAESFDPQTAADREAELVLVRGLRAAFPGIRIVGEEHAAGLDDDGDDDDGEDNDDNEDGDAKQEAHGDGSAEAGKLEGDDAAGSEGKVDFAKLIERHAKGPHGAAAEVDLDRLVVFVDPLDGTRSFISGALRFVTTLVGIAVDGTPVGGVICSVFDGVTLVGGSCVGGVFRHKASSPDVLEAVSSTCANPRKVVASRSRSRGAVAEIMAQLAKQGLIDSACEYASGAGYKFALVVNGDVGIYPFPREGTCRWDTCAGTALILAQGGTVLNRLGEPIVYQEGKVKNDQGFVAARDPALCAKILEHLVLHGAATAAAQVQ